MTNDHITFTMLLNELWSVRPERKCNNLNGLCIFNQKIRKDFYMKCDALLFQGSICNILGQSTHFYSNLASQTIPLETLFPQNVKDHQFLHCTCNSKQFFLLSKKKENGSYSYILYQFDYSQVICSICQQQEIQPKELKKYTKSYEFKSINTYIFCSENYVALVFNGTNFFDLFLYFLNTDGQFHSNSLPENFGSLTGSNDFFSYRTHNSIYTFKYTDKWEEKCIKLDPDPYFPHLLYSPLKGICFLHKKLDAIKKLKGAIFTFPTSIPECFSVQGLGLIGIKELNNQFQCYHIEFDQSIKLNTEIPLEGSESKSIKVEDILNSFVPIRDCIHWLRLGQSCLIHSTVRFINRESKPDIGFINFENTDFDFEI